MAQNPETDGPMGFGGKTTLLGMGCVCWAYRRQGVTLDAAGKIGKWLY